MTAFSSLYERLLTQELGSEDSTRLFTTERRKAAVNDGIQEFADLTECFVRVSSVTWAGGTLEMDLNSTGTIPLGDFVRLAAKQSIEVHYTDASSNRTILAVGEDIQIKDVAWLNRYEPGWRLSTVASSAMQLPRYCYERVDGSARYLGFTPPISTGSSASVLVLIPYVAKPPVLTSDTSEPYAGRTDLRPFHRAAVNYAAHQLEKLRRDGAASQGQLQTFLSWVTRWIHARRTKGGTTLTYARRYFHGETQGEDPRR